MKSTSTLVLDQSWSEPLSSRHATLPSFGSRDTFDHEQLEILLVDDDRSFGSILKRAAAKDGLNLTVCPDIDSLATEMHRPFAVAILDYDLGSVTGVEIMSYLENRDWSAPFVMISQSALPRRDVNARGAAPRFVPKASGHRAIIAAVFAAHASALARRR